MPFNASVFDRTESYVAIQRSQEPAMNIIHTVTAHQTVKMGV